MIFGSDRISSAYTAISRLPSYAKPAYLLTFNEPNYANGGIEDTNILDPATAASLWPQLRSRFDPLGIQLIAPSPITCSGDPNCRNVGTAAGWLTQFQQVHFAIILPEKVGGLKIAWCIVQVFFSIKLHVEDIRVYLL